MARQILLILIRIYQKIFSPDRGILYYIRWRGTCKFYPTCSEYMYQAVEQYGAVKGSYLGVRRVFRCHPWSAGGYDPIIKK